MLKAIEVSRLAKQGIEAQQGFTNGIIPSTDVQFLEDGNGFVFRMDSFLHDLLPLFPNSLKCVPSPWRSCPLCHADRRAWPV